MGDSPDIAEYRARLEAIKAKQQASRAAATGSPVVASHSPTPTAGPVSDAPALPAVEARSAPADDHSVFVGSVDFSVRKEQLEEFFEACGQIKRTTIITDHFTHKPKGFAYVEFVELDGVENALLLDDHLLAGRNIKVCRKRENKPKPGGRAPRRRFRRS
jgi:RNA recognition motif-containing protein